MDLLLVMEHWTSSWEFAHPVHMCFVDLEKAYKCTLGSPVGRAAGVWGTGPIMISHLVHNMARVSCIHVLCTKSNMFLVGVGLAGICTAEH